MKKLIALTVTALSLATLPAYADPGNGRWNNNGRHDDRSAMWAGVAAIGAIVGLAILAEHNRPTYAASAPVVYPDAAYQPQAYPPSVYQQPAYHAPVAYTPQPDYAPPQATANLWYYCPSSAMYYPNTQFCPEGWQAVPARTY